MPLTRYQIRSEYGLADPELYRAADKDDPEALLEGVAMAGLVGILRQLGDLAEFAAEMFHDLHEEVMATAARGHGVMVRMQQLEAEFPSIEKALLSRTDHSPFFFNTGVDWHPNLQTEQGLVTHGDLPHCVMDSYEECRGPPRLFLLDKFDVAGAGACLKRYTDPSFFRLETSSETSMTEIHREKKSRKAKKRGLRGKNGGTPEIAPTTHPKLHQLFLEERVEGGHTDPARFVKLKTRKLDGYPFYPKSGESYMEKFVLIPPDNKLGYGEIASNPKLLMWNMDDTRDSVTEIPEVSVVNVVEKSCHGTETKVLSTNTQENVPKLNLNGEMIDRDIETVPECSHGSEAEKTASKIPDRIVDKNFLSNLKGMSECLQDRSHSEDLTSELDNYVDALATMESETETDNEGRPKNVSGFLNVVKDDPDSEVDEARMDNPTRFSDSQSIGNTSASENGCNLFEKWRSSCSYSDTASISTENDPSDKEKTSGCIPSSGIYESGTMSLLSNVIPANKDPKGYDFDEDRSVSGSDVDRQASCSSHGSSSGPISENNGSYSPINEPLAPEVVETLDSARLDLKKGGTDRNWPNLVNSSVAGTPLDVKDPCVSSQALSELPVPDSEGSRCTTTTDNAIQTNYGADCCCKTLANPELSSKLSDGTRAGEQFSCSTGLSTEASPDGVVSKVGSPIRVAQVHSENILNSVADNFTLTKPVPEVDSLGSVYGPSSENAPAFGTAADESVSEAHKDALENGNVMPTETIESTMSDVRLEDNKSMADTSPHSSIYGEQLLDTSAQCNFSYAGKGFDDHVKLENVAPEIVPEEYFTPSYNGVTEENTRQSSSGAGVLCHKVPESDQTLLADYNPESEEKMQADQLEVSSEGLDATPSESVCTDPLNEEVSDNICHSSLVISNNIDLANGKPFVLQMSLDQSDTEPETKPPPQCNCLNNCLDSSVLDVCDPSERGTPLKQSVGVRIPMESHTLADGAILQSDVCKGLPSELVPESADLEPNGAILQSDVCKGLPSEFVPESADLEPNSFTQHLNSDSISPNFGLPFETPPLPPLPPIQWRIGKAQHSLPSSPGEPVDYSKASFPGASPFGAARNCQFRFAALDDDSMVPKGKSVDTVSVEESKSKQLAADYANNADNLSPSHTKFPTTGASLNAQYESSGFERTELVNPSVTLPASSDEGLRRDFGSGEQKLVQSTSTTSSLATSVEHVIQSRNLDSSREMPLQSQNQSAANEDFRDETSEDVSRNSGDSHHCPDTKALTSTQSTKVEEEHQFVPQASDGATAEPSNSSLPKMLTGTVEDAMWPVNAFAVAPTLDAEKPNEVPTVKLPRPRSPLVDAVAAHDRSSMRKVSERVWPPVEPKEDEKDLLLAQIRNKSFNLKPAVMTRPNMQVGPRTNLKVAAILEKASTIRQAMAGSDEDDDSDSWSDS